MLALVVCSACGRGVCDLCFRFRIDERPSRVRCAYEASTRRNRRVSLAVAFAGVASGIVVLVFRRATFGDATPLFVGVAALGAVAVACLIATSGRSAERHVVEARDRSVPFDRDAEAWSR